MDRAFDTPGLFIKLLAVASMALAASCGPATVATGPVIPDVTVLPGCNTHPVVQEAGLRWEVNSERWADGPIPVDYTSGLRMPIAQETKSAMSKMTSPPPKNHYLILDVSLTNQMAQPISFNSGGYTPVVYQVKDPAGRTYRAEGMLGSFDRASSMTIQGIGSLNPNDAIRGTVVFDVPPGTYTYSMWLNEFVGRTLSTRFFDTSKQLLACRV